MVEWLPEAEDVNVNAYGIRLASERSWYTIFPSYVCSTSLACWADDDDMSHETVVGHGRVYLTSSS
jgi:hypothetical protein